MTRGFNFFMLCLAILFSTGAYAQCDNSGNAYGSGTAPTTGSVTVESCNYAGEVATLSGVAAGVTYESSTDFSGYFTITEGSASGTVINHGAAPLTWTATIAGTYYIHLNTDAACGTDASCHSNVVTYLGSGCLDNSNLSSTNLTTTSADLDWTENGSATTWNIEYGTAGFTLGNGTIVSATAKPYNLTGLSAATTYDWYVRAICGTNPGDTSAWSNASSFSTLCNPFTPPYSEDFTSFLPNCWEEAGSGDPSTSPSNLGSSLWNSTDYLNSSTNGDGAKINLYTNNREDWLISPVFDLSGSSYEVAINAGITSYNGTSAATMGSDDTVQVAISTDAGATWSVLYTWDLNNQPPLTGALYSIDLSAYTSSSNIIGIWATDNAVNDPEDYDFHIGNFEVRVPPACTAPTVDSTSSVTLNSAVLNWTENGTATEWEIEYGSAGFTQGTGDSVIVTSNPHTLSGLTQNTSYDWYVKSICGPADTSAYAGPLSFNTPCPSFSVPYTESFAINYPSCWSRNDNAEVETTTCAAGGTGYALQVHGVAGVFAESPEIDITGLTSIKVSYLWRGACNNAPEAADNINVEYWDGSSWVVAKNYDGSNEPTTYTPDSFLVGSAAITGNIFKVRFFMVAGSGSQFDDFTFDDVTIESGPSCVPPTSLATTNVTPNSADLAFTSGAAQWQIEYGQSGFTQGNGTVVLTSSNPYNLTGLTANTSYDWYIRSICGPGPNDTSSWSSAVNFTTPCTAFTAPYFNDFETDALDAPPSCWLEYNSYSTSAFVEVEDFTGTGAPFAGSQAMYIYNYFGYTQGSDTLIAISPQFSDLSAGDKQIRFQGNSDDPTTTLIIGTIGSASPSATFNPVDTIVFAAADTYQEVIVPFTTANGYNGTDEYIVLAHDLNNTFDYIRIDNFNYEQIPTCPKPQALNASNATPTSVDLDWTNGGTETEWQIAYGAAGFSLGTGNRVIANSNPTTVSGLNANTNYDFYVRAVCSTTDSSAWDGPISFETLCNASAAPFTESFTTNALPNCWTESSVSGDSWEFGTSVDFGSASTRPDAFGNTGEYANIDFSDDPDTTALITPIVDVTGLSNPRLTFFYNSQTTSTSFSPFNRLIVDYWNGTTWVNITVIDTLTTAGWTKYEFSASGYTYNTNFVQFRFSAQEGGAAIGGTGTSTFDQDLMLDEVVVEETPACAAPTTLASANVTATAADLSWVENNSATSWMISYGPVGFTPGSGTEVVVSTNPYTLAGLSSATDYEWAVRSYCSATDSSAWSLVSSFTTPCPPSLAAPYTESFVTNALPNCWTESSVSSGDAWEYGNTVDFGTTSIVRPDAFGNTGEYASIDFSDDPDTTAIITPVVDVSSLTNPRLTFYYNSQSDDNSFSPFNRLIVDYWNGSAWVNITVIDTLTTAGWTKYEFSASAYTHNTNFVQFRFSAQEGGAAIGGTGTFTFNQDLMLDEVVVEETPTCLTPTSAASANVTTTAADLSWVENNSATSWMISYGPAGFTPGSGTEVVVSTNPYTLTGLSSATTYEWAVKSYCSATDSSTYSIVRSFTTLCAPFNAPFSESFDNTTQPNCWSQSAISGGPWVFDSGFTWNTQGCAFVPADHTGNSGSFAALDFSVPDAGVVLEMPNVDVTSLTAPYLEFYYVQCNNLSPNNELFIEAYNGSSWDSVTVIQRGTNGWERFGFQLGTFTYGANLVKIRFRAEDGGGTQFYGDMGLDDISIDNAPPAELEASMVVAPSSGCGLSATETVSVSITNNGSAAQTGFSVGYSLNGTAITPETYTASIAPGATATYNFTATADLSTVGTYNFVAYLNLTGDVDNTNDTASTVVLSSSVVTSFPYAESFETGNAGWLVSGNTSWALGAPSATLINSASNGSAAWVTNLSGNYNDSELGYVNSPCFDFSSILDPYIELDIWYDIESQWDGALLQASTDNGATWFTVGQQNDPNNWYNDTAAVIVDQNIDPTGQSWTGDGTGTVSGSGGWITAGHELNSLAGESSVRLRMLFASDAFTNAEGMAFDNVRVFDSIPTYYPVGDINKVDATTGVADSLDVRVTTSGTVVGVDLDGNNGLSFHIIDMASGSQEGINIFNFNDVSNYTVNEGDSILVRGSVDQFNGLQEVFVDSIEVISTNAFIPSPMKVSDLSESTESKHIQLDSLVIVNGSQSNSYNMTATTVGGLTVTIRVDEDTDVNDSLNAAMASLITGDTICSIIGIGGQFDSSNPYTSGYQIFPMRFSDIDTTSCQVVGLNKLTNNKVELNIYPNPTSGEFMIRTSGLNNDNALITVRDISGKVILRENIVDSNSAFTKSFNLVDQAKGLYFINIIDGENQYNQKLIIQ